MTKEFGVLLAKMFYGKGIKQVPFVLSYDAYDGFVSEWNKLNDNKLNKILNNNG